VDGDTVIAVGPEQVIGVDETTGRQVWSVDRDLGPSVPPAVTSVDGASVVVYTEGFGEGPPDQNASASQTESSTPSTSSSPSPSEGSGGSTGEAFDSHVAAIDAATQKPLWKPVALDAVSRTGVVADGGMAFVGANGGKVYAIDLADGTIAWSVELNRPLVTPLTVVEGKVLVGLQADADARVPTLVALEATDGEESWRLDDEATASIVSTAASSGGRAYVTFSGGQESSVDAVDVASGTRLWRTRFPRFFDPTGTAPPVVTTDAVYATDASGETYRLDPATGSRLWGFALNEGVLQASPIVTGDDVLVGTIDGSLVAFATSSGELIWRGDAGSPIRAIAVAGDRVILVRAGVGAGMVAFEHDPDGALVRETSPTEPDVGQLAGGIAAAVVAVAAAGLLLGRVLARRLGPAFPDEDVDTEIDVEDDGQDEL
jgi:outer membrane protein assembly factor BamB